MNNNKDDKYFTWLPMSVAPGRNSKVLMQSDCGATCDSLPSNLYNRLHCLDALKPSWAKIYPYAGDPIIFIGKQAIVCEGQNKFEVQDFKIIRSDDVCGKPVQLSDKDSERLGLITFLSESSHHRSLRSNYPALTSTHHLGGTFAGGGGGVTLLPKSTIKASWILSTCRYLVYLTQLVLFIFGLLHCQELSQITKIHF